MNLSFRKKGIPKWLIRQVLLVASVFFGSLVLFIFLINIRTGESTTRAEGASLPVVSMTACGRETESLPAYIKPMDACYMRDAVLPLDSTRVLPIHIETFGNKISAASYEIRSLDTERKIAETVFDSIPTEESGVITLKPQLQNLLQDGGEYLFVLTLTCEERPLYFYTRVIMPAESHIEEILAFTEDFHQKALAGDAEALAPYLEPSPDAALMDTTGFAEVSISSTASEVAWQGFTGNAIAAPSICFNEVSTDYSALTMKFVMSDGTREYDTEEYFKVRFGPQRLYLLDYQRTMTERFTTKKERLNENLLTLGVVPTGNDYLANETGLIVAFTQNGELFVYDALKSQYTTVFSFTPEGASPDERTRRNDHAIKLLSIDEHGTIVFVVYGYMNSGNHEGSCGIDVMKYDGVTGTVTEQAFISSERSFQVLNANFTELIYRSSTDDFYIMADGSFVHVDLSNMKVEMLTDPIPTEDYAVSGSRRYLALPGGSLKEGAFSSKGKGGASEILPGKVGSIVVLDLEEGTARIIEPEGGNILRPLAFMEDDLVYGEAKAGDVYKTAAGATVYAMHRFVIVPVAEDETEALLTYEKPGVYVTGIMKADNSMITIYRVKKLDDGTYVSADNDTVRASDAEINRAVSLVHKKEEGRGQIAQLKLAKSSEYATAVSSARAPYVLLSKDEVIDIDVDSESRQYFVYIGSRIVLSTENVSEAVTTADRELGIVIDNSQNTIWRRGKGSYKDNSEGLLRNTYEDSRAAALAVMLSASGHNVDTASLLEQGVSVSDIAAAVLKDDKVLDFYGITLNEALYYVDRGEVVYAEYLDENQNTQAVAITGFDPKNIQYLDPATGKVKKMGINDATEAFAAGGGIYITRIPKAVE